MSPGRYCVAGLVSSKCDYTLIGIRVNRSRPIFQKISEINSEEGADHFPDSTKKSPGWWCKVEKGSRMHSESTIKPASQNTWNPSRTQ
jgi:hypothetical protein